MVKKLLYLGCLLVFLTALPVGSFAQGGQQQGTMQDGQSSSPTTPTSANDGLSSCDSCGYCDKAKAPSNWKTCRACLYPEASENATSNDTLKLSLNENKELAAPTPAVGQYFVGQLDLCVQTDTFDIFKGEPGGAGAGIFITALLRVVFSIAGGIAFLYILYGAIVVLTSQNEPEKLNYGKRLIVGAIVGLLFALSSVFIVNLVANQILKVPGVGN